MTLFQSILLSHYLPSTPFCSASSICCKQLPTLHRGPLTKKDFYVSSLYFVLHLRSLNPSFHFCVKGPRPSRKLGLRPLSTSVDHAIVDMT